MFHFPLCADGSVCVYVTHMLLVLTMYYVKVLIICVYTSDNKNGFKLAAALRSCPTGNWDAATNGPPRRFIQDCLSVCLRDLTKTNEWISTN